MRKVFLCISGLLFVLTSVAKANWPKGTYVCDVIESTDYRTKKFNGPLIIYFNLNATHKNYRPWFLHIYQAPNGTGIFPGLELLSLGIDPRFNREQQRRDCHFDESGFDEASPVATNTFYSSEKCPGGFSQSFAVDFLVSGAEYGKGIFKMTNIDGVESYIEFERCKLYYDAP